MKKGFVRFDFYLDRLEKLCFRASAEINSALWLYANDARTPLFMLEGLAKIYGGLHDKNRFGKIQTHFKLLEDALGAIDYYDSFAKEFSANKEIPAETAAYVRTQADKSARRANGLLIKEKWTGENANRTSKIRKKLSGADWMKEESETVAIEKFYKIQIKEINAFAAKYKNGFTEIETQVHALRRKLRWLSIYPQALQGCIQLTQSDAPDKNIDKYLTPEIINSPFNKMPPAGENKYLLTLDENRFFALSWLIAELGKLKDKGLRALLIDEAARQSKTAAHAESVKQTRRLPAPESSDVKEILSEASNICATFFAERNLDKLLNGIVKTG
jgi:hypothetical protein